MKSQGVTEPRRNRAYEETHRELIDTAVRLISEKGIDSLSIAALAREMGINRTTVYYHFDSRESLVEEVKAWSTGQLAEAFPETRPRAERIEHLYRFVLENPELLKMWIDDCLSGGNIRALYPYWDDLVAGIREHFAGTRHEGAIDPEVFCVNLLTTAFIGPRVFKSSVCPGADNESVVARFKAETIRMLEDLAMM